MSDGSSAILSALKTTFDRDRMRPLSLYEPLHLFSTVFSLSPPLEHTLLITSKTAYFARDAASRVNYTVSLSAGLRMITGVRCQLGVR